MLKQSLQTIIECLQQGETPFLDPKVFAVFEEEKMASYEFLTSDVRSQIEKTLTKADVPTFERALKACETGELAWLGFKIVYNPKEALINNDNEVTKKFGDIASAHANHLVFFCNDNKEVVCSQEYSPRDLMQMKDITRGPGMHNAQFDGLIWFSTPLFTAKKVWLLGASDVASELAALASHVGFRVSVVDYDPAFLSAERFPDAERILLPGDDFAALAQYQAEADDYVCVLTRGHMFDPESCVWATKCGVHYVGMMGCKGKNDTVRELCISLGMPSEAWDSIKRPIGLKFGAKTTAELAIAIVAELIDVRYKENYSEQARQKHENSIY